MAGSITEMEKSESDSQYSQFVWDENSKLYFHASSGFYHDPNAGWYYSTRDGLYYKFEDGDYVLLNSDQNDKCETSEMESDVPESSSRDEQCAKVASKDEIGNAEFSNSYSPENHRPPSEWLEETLIDLYLSGYKSQAIDEVCGDATSPKKTDEADNVEFQPNEDTDAYELEEGEWIPEDDFDADQSNEDSLDDGFAREEEENWRSQYGQVIRSSEEDEEGKIDIQAVELWDWSTVKGTRKNGKGEITKLVGRLMRKSAKLHPSMPCGGVRLKTAPICEVRLDLVRVTTGQVYRLRNPSSELLASLSAYDSSDPTKDWGFPELSLHEVKQSVNDPKPDAKAGGKSSAVAREKNLSAQNKSQTYRDRAAERRALHGAFSVAPGQDGDSESGLRSEEAVAQALDMSFGAGSYARKLLEGMGWKQGEALGKSMKGLVEPIQAEGNIGSAGLGWPRERSKLPFNY